MPNGDGTGPLGLGQRRSKRGKCPNLRNRVFMNQKRDKQPLTDRTSLFDKSSLIKSGGEFTNSRWFRYSIKAFAFALTVLPIARRIEQKRRSQDLIPNANKRENLLEQ